MTEQIFDKGKVSNPEGAVVLDPETKQPNGVVLPMNALIDVGVWIPDTWSDPLPSDDRFYNAHFTDDQGHSGIINMDDFIFV